jgi:hypothetical protein
VKQIQKTDDFSYRYNLAEIFAPWAAELIVENTIKNALTALAKIETRSLKLLSKNFKAGWDTADLQTTITNFVGKDPTFEISTSGKIVWKSESSKYIVVQDPLNKYLRIEDTSLKGSRINTDLNGTIPNNKVINGKTSGRSQTEYNEVTHFNY